MVKKKAKKDDDDWTGTNFTDMNKDEDGQDLGGLMSLLKVKKDKKKPKATVASALESKSKGKGSGIDTDDVPEVEPSKSIENDPLMDDGAPEIKLKSKKEKERERKERAKLSQKQSKTKKEQTLMKEVEKSSVTVKQDEAKNEVPKVEPKLKGKAAQIAKLREALEEKKRLEDEQRRLEEEAIRKEKEEKQKLAQQEQLKEAERLKKKEKEKQRKLKLKEQGKYLTPAQKQQKLQQQAKLEAMLKAGNIVVPVVNSVEEKSAVIDEEPKKKRVVYDNKKKKLPKKQEGSDNIPQANVDETETKADSDDDWEKDVNPIEVEVDDWELSDVEVYSIGKVVITSSASAENISKLPAGVVPQKKAEKPKPAANQAVAVDLPSQTITKQVVVPIPVARTQQTTTSSNSSLLPIEPKDEEIVSQISESNDSTDASEEELSDEELTAAEQQAMVRKEEAKKRKEARIKAAHEAKSAEDLRSPICVILGHVDTGKTKILDKIRQTNVQDGEAGGITQQIGATYFPVAAVEEKTAMIHKGQPSGYKLPGLLVIDTPGHESFTNLRKRGSSLCNIAVLVVDIVHGLEPQTVESLNLLRRRKTPFIVALNKIDRMFDWQANPNFPTQDTLALQKPSVLSEFQDRVKHTIVEFAEQGLNACLYWENKNVGKYVSLVPTSAVTGEGIPDLLHLLVQLTQTRLTDSLMYLSELECTVLEVKVIEGLGTTIDVILSNGRLNEGDKICVCGLNGPIVTHIRALLTPQPMRELRVKGQYQHHKTVKASQGVKISAPFLENAIAGSKLLVITEDDDEDAVKESVMEDMQNFMSAIDKSGKGVCVQASTLGSLEALLSFLKDSNIPVSGINIGPIHKKDIIRASVMLERCREYAMILAFDVEIDKDAELLAKDMGVRIFSADIIYHLFDQFTAHMKQLEEQKRQDALPSAIFPCVLTMVPDAIFNKRAPLIMGVEVTEGILKIGTPLCIINEVTTFY